MTGERDDRDDRPASSEQDEDTEAILSRRRFLIETALEGAGVTMAVAACKADADEGTKPPPKVCLKVAPPRKKDVEEPDDKPQVCLKVAPPKKDEDVTEPKPRPQVCLKVAPKKDEDVTEPKPRPQVCLKVKPRKDKDKGKGKDKPRICLKVAPKKPGKDDEKRAK